MNACEVRNNKPRYKACISADDIGDVVGSKPHS